MQHLSFLSFIQYLYCIFSLFKFFKLNFIWQTFFNSLVSFYNNTASLYEFFPAILLSARCKFDNLEI